ncbi:MAG: hypothetical protein KBD24_01640 [Candidatus Pacebacteria bacterium]|nr:hypothetical protein [Candidatus Paceibacterota bacterium]
MQTALFVLGSALGVAVSVWIILVILMFVAFVVAPFLVNDPKNPEKFYLFTKMEQGQLKMVMRGDHVVGYIMYMPEKMLRRNKTDVAIRHHVTIENDEFADVLSRRDTNLPADADVDDLFYWSSWILRWWRVRVYRANGCLFVGIPPWQEIRQRPFKNAKFEEVIVGGKMVRTIKYEDQTTDHLRVREFTRPFIVYQVETSDGLAVSVYGEVVLRTVNAFRTSFGIDRFETRVDRLVLTRVNDFVKTQPIASILLAKADTMRALERNLIGYVDAGGLVVNGTLASTLKDWGMEIVRVHVMEYESNLTEEQAKALTAEWVADQLKKARMKQGDGDAEYLGSLGSKLAGNPVLAHAYTQIEVAKAAAGGKGTTTVVLGGGNQSSAPDPAILAELQRIRNK